MLNIGNTHINSALTSTGIGLANAMVGLMALSGLLGRGEEPRNDKTNCDPCDSARLHAPVSQILDPPLPNSDLGGERAPRVPRELALHTASERTVPGKYGKGEIFLPELELRPSPVGGTGVFTRHFIPKGTYLTMYGGEVHNNKESVLGLREEGEDTHVKRIGSRNFGHWLDSRVRNAFTLVYYVQNHLLGGFINDCYKTGKKKNVSEVDIEGTVRHPYAKGRSSTVT